MGISKTGPFVMMWKKNMGVIEISHPDYVDLRPSDFVLDPYLPLTDSSELVLQMVCPSLDTSILKQAISTWENLVPDGTLGRDDMRDIYYAWHISGDEWI